MDTENAVNVTAKPNSSNYWGIAIAVIALLISIALGFLVHQSQQIIKQVRLQASTQMATLQHNQGNAQNLQTLFTQKLAAIKTAQTNIVQLRKQMLNAYHKSLNALQNDKVNYQKHLDNAHALYLVKLANAKLRYEHDIPASLVILNAAQTALNQNTNLAASTAKRALISDLQTLKTFSMTDTQKIYLKLSAIDGLINHLPIIITTKMKTRKTPKNQKANTWRQSLHNSWESLKGIIIIRHTAQGSPAFVTQSEKQALLQNLHETLLQTQSALMRHDDKIYHTNLKRMVHWLNMYFDTNTAAVNHILTALKNLNTININPTLPSLSRSIHALTALQTNEDKIV